MTESVPKVENGQLLISNRNDKYTQIVQSNDHQWIADEPASTSKTQESLQV